MCAGTVPAGDCPRKRLPLRNAYWDSPFGTVPRLGGCGRGLDGHRRDVAPQLLETVVVPRLRSEDVEHRVEVVADDPGALGSALDVPGQQPLVVLEALVHLVPDRLRLAGVATGADDEEVGVAAHGPHVEDDHVLRH